MGATPESESELSMTFFKRISGLTLISNQILQKGTARMAAVLFPGLITFHCSLLMSQLFLSSHNYTVFICSSSCGQTRELEPCLHIGGVCCAMILQRKKYHKNRSIFMEISVQYAFSIMKMQAKNNTLSTM